MELFDIYKFGIKDWFFIILFLLFFIEQGFYIFLGSYPYRYGLLIRTGFVPVREISSWISAKKSLRSMAVKISKKNKEIYLRRKLFGIWGPQLFIGQIQYNGAGILKIRIGPFATILILIFLISSLYSLSSGGDYFYRFMNFFLLAILIVWFYFDFFRNYKKMITHILINNRDLESDQSKDLI